jgi:hypothetical protein
MKNQNDTPDRKGADPEHGETDVPASATGMFQRPLAPSAQPGFNDPDELRAAASAETPSSRASGGLKEGSPAVQAAHPAADASSGGEGTSPGEFTRLFQAITPNAQPMQPYAPNQTSASSQTPLPAPMSADANVGDANAGEFTRIFTRVPKEPNAPSAVPIPSVSPQVGEDPHASETGEFTRLMRAAEPAKPAGTSAAPAVVSSAPASNPVRGMSAPGGNDAASGSAGVTELFVAPTHGPAAVEAALPSSPVSGKNASRIAPGLASAHASSVYQGGSFSRESPSAGEFTQLFRALDRASEPFNSMSGVGTPSAKAPPTPQAGQLPEAGAFTQLMQSLVQEGAVGNRAELPVEPRTDVVAPSARTWPEPMPGRSVGPADNSDSFTRIISTSAAREEAAKGTLSGADGSPAQESASASSSAPMSGRRQQFQLPSVPRAAAFGQPAATPALPLQPALAPASGSQSRLHAYLPLLLIINAILMAVLIVLVILSLRHH